MLGYEKPRRRSPFDAHEYWQQRQSKRNQRARAELAAVGNDNELTFEKAFSRDRLYACWEQLKLKNGPAPGVDGITFDDVSPFELGQIAGMVSTAVLNGSYRPHPTRPVKIPKTSSGWRTLQIGILADRMVAKAFNIAVQSLLEEVYLDGSWGFRVGRSPLAMLADMEANMIKNDCWVITVDDIANAFDNVPIDRTIAAYSELLNQHANRLPDTGDYLQLLEVILKGSNPDRRIGIDQGNPVSPSALNALLQVNHDTPLEQSGTLWYRYADNLVYVTKSVSEGQQALCQARDLLCHVGMTLKGPGYSTNLATGDTALLGLTLRTRDNCLQLTTGYQAWTKLDLVLEQAHESSNPHEAASAGLCGWMEACGFAFESGEDVVREVLQHAARHGFHEVSRETVSGGWNSSHRRWQECRKAAMGRYGL